MCVCVILRGVVDDDVLYIRGGVGSILIIPSATPLLPPPRARVLQTCPFQLLPT